MCLKLGYTCLHQAAQQGQLAVINLLLKYEASPNAVTHVRHPLLVVMGIEPVNKSSVSVRFGQGKGSDSVRLEFCPGSIRFSSIRLKLYFRFGSVRFA